MPIDYSIESKVHRRAAAHPLACANYHMQAADLIDKNEMQKAKDIAQDALEHWEQAQAATFAACIKDMAWESSVT